jgi:hypothetical protein
LALQLGCLLTPSAAPTRKLKHSKTQTPQKSNTGKQASQAQRQPEHSKTQTPENPNTGIQASQAQRQPEHSKTQTPENPNTGIQASQAQRQPEHSKTQTPENPNTGIQASQAQRQPEHSKTQTLKYSENDSFLCIHSKGVPAHPARQTDADDPVRYAGDTGLVVRLCIDQ